MSWYDAGVIVDTIFRQFDIQCKVIHEKWLFIVHVLPIITNWYRLAALPHQLLSVQMSSPVSFDGVDIVCFDQDVICPPQVTPLFLDLAQGEWVCNNHPRMYCTVECVVDEATGEVVAKWLGNQCAKVDTFPIPALVAILQCRFSHKLRVVADSFLSMPSR